MKKRFKNSVNNVVTPFLILMAMFVFGFGCNTSKPTPYPLTGWQIDFKQPAPAITTDWQDYIQQLPPEEKKFARLGNFFKDGTGQHAIPIRIPLNGTDWEYILIYDKDNKRSKVIKYAVGRYSS